jgi:hypothetical protein
MGSDGKLAISPPQLITLFEDDSTEAVEDPPAKDKYSSQSIYWFALNRSMMLGFGRVRACVGARVCGSARARACGRTYVGARVRRGAHVWARARESACLCVPV